jgi:hypothetical protein
MRGPAKDRNPDHPFGGYLVHQHSATIAVSFFRGLKPSNTIALADGRPQLARSMPRLLAERACPCAATRCAAGAGVVEIALAVAGEP